VQFFPTERRIVESNPVMFTPPAEIIVDMADAAAIPARRQIRRWGDEAPAGILADHGDPARGDVPACAL